MLLIWLAVALPIYIYIYFRHLKPQVTGVIKVLAPQTMDYNKAKIRKHYHRFVLFDSLPKNGLKKKTNWVNPDFPIFPT